MQHNRKSSRRNGLAVIVALVCLSTVMLLGVSVIKYAAISRQQLREKQRRAQAMALAESGLARAAAQLDRKRTYSGENWHIEPIELADRWPAEVAIAVLAVEGHPEQRTLRAVAEYPAGATDRSRVTLSVPYTFLDSGDAP